MKMKMKAIYMLLFKEHYGCKGYGTGSSEITKHFYGGTGSAIIKLKK